MEQQNETNSKILSFTDDARFTVFSVSNEWYETQKDTNDVKALFNRATHDVSSDFKDLTPKLLREF